MSIEIEVYLHRNVLPTVASWQHQITQAGFDLSLDIDDPLQEQSGFQSATYNGVSTGFELHFDQIGEQLDPQLLLSIAECDIVATFRFGGDQNEADAATIASGVLAQTCNGILYDTEAGTVITAENAVANAREELRKSEQSRAMYATPAFQREMADREKRYRKKWWQLW